MAAASSSTGAVGTCPLGDDGETRFCLIVRCHPARRLELVYRPGNPEEPPAPRVEIRIGRFGANVDLTVLANGSTFCRSRVVTICCAPWRSRGGRTRCCVCSRPGRNSFSTAFELTRAGPMIERRASSLPSLERDPISRDRLTALDSCLVAFSFEEPASTSSENAPRRGLSPAGLRRSRPGWPGSSIVAGIVQASPSAIFCIVPRRILPERVFGRRSTITASLKAATGPIRSRTSADELAARSRPRARRRPPSARRSRSGTWPFSASATPITAHSATSGCAASTSSMPPVESRWPATLMMSSVRPMT